MILKRLFELAEREELLADPAFESLPVPYIVKLNRAGEFLGIEERRNEVPVLSRKKNAPPKIELDKGKEVSVPKPHGSPNNRGFARYFVDTLARVLPVSDEPKSVASRETFWQQLEHAAAESADPALKAVVTFGEQLRNDATLAGRVRQEVAGKRPDPGNRCTFAWAPDEGATIVDRGPVREWYRQFFESFVGERHQAGPAGLCQITGEIGPLPSAHPGKIGGLPGGMSSGVSLVSYDKAAFESYGLDRAANAGIGYRAADGYLRALTALVGNKLGKQKTRLKVGNVLFLFWTRQPANTVDLNQLDEPEPDEVARLIQSAERGRMSYAADPNQFYCLGLSGYAARAIVRDYLEAPLPEVQFNLGRWFRDLQIVDASFEGQGQVTATFRLWPLAASTARESDDVPPELPGQLMHAAIKGWPLPDSILAACLQRLRVERGGQQFRPARMALIKLCLNRIHCLGDQAMTDSLDEKRTEDRAYVCGRLLAFLALCQSHSQDRRDFGTEAQILERYFGSASTSPRSVLPTLLRLNRHHISKIRDGKPGLAFNLEAELDELLLPFKSSGAEKPDFPPILSLPEQGRFALGFYHQRANYRRQSAERKLQAAASQNNQ